MSESTTTAPKASKKAPAEPVLSDAQKLSKARTNALSTLRLKHLDEFNRYMAAEAETLNVKWERKLTKEEKRRAQFAALLAEDPSLAEIVTGTPDPS